MRFTGIGGGCMGVVCGGLGGRGLEINIIQIQKTYLGCIIIYFRVGFLILLFTYVNFVPFSFIIYPIIYSFILGVIRGGGYFVFKVLTLTGCTRIFGVPRHSSGKGAR